MYLPFDFNCFQILSKIVVNLSPKSFIVSTLKSRLLIHFELICVYVGGWYVESNFILRLWISNCFSPVYWRDCSVEWTWHYCQTPIGHGLWNSFQSLASVPPTSMYIHMSTAHCFDYCKLVVKSEIWKYKISKLVLLYLGLFWLLGAFSNFT